MNIASLHMIKFLATYSVVLFSVIFILNIGNPRLGPDERAILLMGLGLIVIWCVIGGSLMYHYRATFRRFFQRIPLSWPVKFVLFATIFAFLEEVVTVSLTNTAPFFGASMETAHITASANYFDTVFGHSALLFVGWFIAYAWLLKRYAFTTIEIFLLFGLLGSIAETQGGIGHLFAGFWFFVYGLMIFLPAYSIPQDRHLPRPKLFQFTLALILPIICMIPFGLLMVAYIHFFDPQFFMVI